MAGMTRNQKENNCRPCDLDLHLNETVTTSLVMTTVELHKSPATMLSCLPDPSARPPRLPVVFDHRMSPEHRQTDGEAPLQMAREISNKRHLSTCSNE
jgi:hypothetical protein